MPKQNGAKKTMNMTAPRPPCRRPNQSTTPPDRLDWDFLHDPKAAEAGDDAKLRRDLTTDRILGPIERQSLSSVSIEYLEEHRVKCSSLELSDCALAPNAVSFGLRAMAPGTVDNVLQGGQHIEKQYGVVDVEDLTPRRRPVEISSFPDVFAQLPPETREDAEILQDTINGYFGTLQMSENLKWHPTPM